MNDREPVRYLKRALGVGAFVVLLAPPIGFWVYFGLMSLRFSRLSEGISVEALKAVPEALAVGSMLSFAIGGVPAIVSALLSAWAVWRNGTLSYWQAAGFALAASVVSVLALQLWSYPDVDWRSSLGMMAFVSGVGLGSALVCRWLMGRVGLLPPGVPQANKS